MKCENCVHYDVCENYLNEYHQSIKVPAGMVQDGLRGITKTRCPFERPELSPMEMVAEGLRRSIDAIMPVLQEIATAAGEIVGKLSPAYAKLALLQAAYAWAIDEHPEWVRIMNRTKKRRTAKKYNDRIVRAYIASKIETERKEV